MFAPLNDKQKMEKAVGLASIANDVQKLANAGASDIEQQTFALAARRELAQELPDTQKMGEASQAAEKYKRMMGQSQ
tara:strand:+ start:604 stop:834 length:231 start_codon:yes stop_codon:yes gene_type:complete